MNDLLKQFRTMRKMMRKFDFSGASLSGMSSGPGGPALSFGGLRKKGTAMMRKKKKEKKIKKHKRRR